jgi:prepilin-type N-terminal cleavage/methylation domain-containing protein
MRKGQQGFSLLETMVALTVLLGVGGIVMTGTVQMMKTQGSIANRTEMHTSVRSATELLSQEVGQAGKVALGNAAVTLNGTTAINAITMTVSDASSMFDGENLMVDGGTAQEQVTIAPNGVSTSTNTITLVKNMVNAHPSNAPVTVLGGFASGIVAPAVTNGSDGFTLKMYGDLNSDGNMLYVQYNCDVANGILYRQQLNWNAAAASKIGTPTATQEANMALLTNIRANPGNAPCFTYQVQPVGTDSYVTNVQITLTAQTANVDAVTHAVQTETKALLNVSPRNVYDAFNNATLGFTGRVQPMPPTITALLP